MHTAIEDVNAVAGMYSQRGRIVGKLFIDPIMRCHASLVQSANARQYRLGPLLLPIITNIAPPVSLRLARALLLQRFPHPASDLGGIVVESKYHRPLESLWARDEDTEAAPEGVGSDPRLVRAARMPAAGDHGRLDALTPIAGNALDVEDRDRHTTYCSEPISRILFIDDERNSWAGFSEGTMEYMPEESIPTNEPRWPAVLALLSIGGLYYALP